MKIWSSVRRMKISYLQGLAIIKSFEAGPISEAQWGKCWYDAATSILIQISSTVLKNLIAYLSRIVTFAFGAQFSYDVCEK